MTLSAALRRTLPVALPVALAFAFVACDDAPIAPGTVSAAQAPGVHRQYGTPVKVGNGRARAYTLLDARSGTPLEIGVALDSLAMHGLPAPAGGGNAHGDMHEYQLELPARAPAPYKFVELDWNPAGHGEPYLEAHFDVHFYTISLAERNAIVPSDPAWAAKAAKLPAPEFRRTGFACPCTLLGIPPEQMAVPRMGMHWIDPSSPEFNGKPFTATFIEGVWDGRSIFQEPMVTRSFIMATADATIDLPALKRAQVPGYYPGAYRVSYDAQAKEYRIALSKLAWTE
jgi:hypothetical protein